MRACRPHLCDCSLLYLPFYVLEWSQHSVITAFGDHRWGKLSSITISRMPQSYNKSEETTDDLDWWDLHSGHHVGEIGLWAECVERTQAISFAPTRDKSSILSLIMTAVHFDFVTLLFGYIFPMRVCLVIIYDISNNYWNTNNAASSGRPEIGNFSTAFLVHIIWRLLDFTITNFTQTYPIFLISILIDLQLKENDVFCSFFQPSNW